MKQDFVSDLVTGTGRVTVRAIAAETGLSIATVSRVLNGGDAVVKSAVVRELPGRGDVFGALLILPPEPSADLEALAAHGYPFVVVAPRTAVPRGTASISAALFPASGAVPRHLIELGHALIGVITGPPYWHPRDDRVGGPLAALAE